MWTAKILELAREHGCDLDDLFEQWSERSAIREHVGGMSRDSTEIAAFDDLVLALGDARRGPRSASSQRDDASAKAR